MSDSSSSRKTAAAKSVSITDVAERAGVSVGTVSNVLNRPERVNATMRERVLAAIKELGFRPNTIAKSLRERRTMTLGLVLSDITTPFASVLARTVQAEAAAAGYSVVFADNNESIEREQAALSALHHNGVDGIILAPSPGDQGYLAELQEGQWPVIAVNRRANAADIPSVLTDHFGGAVAATRHLLAHGHRRIAVVTRSPNISSIQDRQHGYRQALDDAQVAFDPSLVVEEVPTVEGGRQAIKELLRRRPKIDAVISLSTAMTLGCVIAFRDSGIRVPSDLAFIGFDDANWSIAMQPPITSVALRAEDVGIEATKRLLEWVATGQQPTECQTLIGTHLIVRESCGCPMSNDLVETGDYLTHSETEDDDLSATKWRSNE